MHKYKWDIEEVVRDINRIKTIAQKHNLSNDEKLIIVDDLAKLSNMLSNTDNFNRSKRASYVDTILANTINRVRFDNNVSINEEANNLQHLKSIINMSSKVIDSIGLYKIKRIKRKYTKSTNELEGIFLIRDMFNDYDYNLWVDFNQFIESGHLNISYYDKSDVLALRSLKKAYANVKNCGNLGLIDDLLYCYIKTKMFEANPNREMSVYNKTLEIFFTLLATDKLKEKGYNDYYSIRLNIFNHFQNWLPEFIYVTKQGNNLKYDIEKNKYVIKHSSSLFDDELSEAYSHGESYKKIMKPFIMAHSNLLAFNLYESYKSDKESVKKVISQLFDMIGVAKDEDIFEFLQDSNCYSRLMEQQQADYKSLKKKRLFIKRK